MESKTLLAIACTGILAVSTVIANCTRDISRYIELKDFTGDGITDVRIDHFKETFMHSYFGTGKVIAKRSKSELYIGDSQKNYSHAILKNKKGRELYFEAEDRTRYFWDGKFYRLSPRR